MFLFEHGLNGFNELLTYDAFTFNTISKAKVENYTQLKSRCMQIIIDL